MSECDLTANCDGTGDGGCFVSCCNLVCPPENPCKEIKIKYYCQPVGACCNPNDQNCYVTNQCQCESNGGEYQGDDSTCTPNNPCAKCVPPCDSDLCLECKDILCESETCPVGFFSNPIDETTAMCCPEDFYFYLDGLCYDAEPGSGLPANSTTGVTIKLCEEEGSVIGAECAYYCNKELEEICCHGNCCAADKPVCCGDGTCCADGQTCCLDEEAGTYSCCNPGQTCCKGSCCPVDKPVCCGDGTCCSAGQTCCLDEGAGTYTCCNPGETCCGGTCCPAGHNCCTESTTSPPYCSPNPCPIPGCMYPGSPSYNPAATCDDGSCRTCCNAGLCVVFDRDGAGNCNDVGNGCCDNYCVCLGTPDCSRTDCSPTYHTGSGPLQSCDRDLDGTPGVSEYLACIQSNDCIQGYLNPDILLEIEKNIENYNKSQAITYDQNNNEVFDQNKLQIYKQEIKEYDFSMLNSCACTCPQTFRYQGLLINYTNEIKAMNEACSKREIIVTTDYECGLTGDGTNFFLAPCCCDYGDTNTYTITASFADGDSAICLDFEWKDYENTKTQKNIKIGEIAILNIGVKDKGESPRCHCSSFCEAECVPYNAPFIKKLEKDKIKVSINKKEIQKRINLIRKKIMKKKRKN